jgi:inosose dehydratase
VRDTLRWAYALNQWNLRMDVFVRHEDQLRALKTLSALGFDHVELSAGTGRWDNLGRPEIIRLNHGDAQGFRDFLSSATIRGVSSMFWDPGQPVEETGWAFWSTRNPADHAAIVEAARPFVGSARGPTGRVRVDVASADRRRHPGDRRGVERGR